jgi:hypothetical protein
MSQISHISSGAQLSDAGSAVGQQRRREPKESDCVFVLPIESPPSELPMPARQGFSAQKTFNGKVANEENLNVAPLDSRRFLQNGDKTKKTAVKAQEADSGEKLSLKQLKELKQSEPISAQRDAVQSPQEQKLSKQKNSAASAEKTDPKQLKAKHSVFVEAKKPETSVNLETSAQKDSALIQSDSYSVSNHGMKNAIFMGPMKPLDSKIPRKAASLTAITPDIQLSVADRFSKAIHLNGDFSGSSTAFFQEDAQQDSSGQGRHQQEGRQSQLNSSLQAGTSTHHSSGVNSHSAQVDSNLMQSLQPIILKHLDQLRRSGKGRLNIQLSLPDGGFLRLKLDMTGNRVKVSFQTDSQELKQKLKEGWSELTQSASKEGIRILEPEFEGKDWLKKYVPSRGERKTAVQQYA